MEYKYAGKIDNRQSGAIKASNGAMVNVGGDNVHQGHRGVYMALTPEERQLIESLRLAKIIKANE